MEWQKVTRGVPQESVLGQMIFNIFLSDLFYNTKDVNIQAYADDEYFMTRMWTLEPLNSGYSSGPNCEPVVHRKRHDRQPRQTPCYGFRDH